MTAKYIVPGYDELHRNFAEFAPIVTYVRLYRTGLILSVGLVSMVAPILFDYL